MPYRPEPTVLDSARFDTQAQLAAFLVLIGLLIPVAALIVGEKGAILGIGFLAGAVLLVVGLAWFVVRLRRMRRMFAEGVEVTGTVVDVRPVLGPQRAIDFEYPVDGQSLRKTYYLSAKVMPALGPGSSLALIVHRSRPRRPFLVDLYG